MSTITIDKRYGTPFEQIVRAENRARRQATTAPAPPPAPPTVHRGPRPAAPSRSYQQRMAALQLANDTRSARATLKREMRARRISLVDLLLAPPAYVETMKVFDLLIAVPKYGRVKVNKVLSGCRISPSKTIGGMSQRQRVELVERLSGF